MSDSSGNNIVKLPKAQIKIVAHPPTYFITANNAPRWFKDSLIEARNSSNHDGRRREIIFAVCFAETYLFEWIRDEVLSRDYKRLERYFPPDKKRGVRQKWKEIPQQLLDDDLIVSVPSLNGQFWEDFKNLVYYRDGLVHAAASRPFNPGLPEEKKPKPGVTTLHDMEAG